MFISKIMASPLGTFLKAFLTAVMSLVMIRYNEGNPCLDKKCIVDIFIAAVFSVLPMIINYINPAYTQYGVGAKSPENA